MAQSAAEYFEVRWRIKGSGEAWAGPRRIAPTSEIVVTELDRTKLYEFEVRSASACGAKSVWVPSDYTVPGAVPPTSIDTLTAQSLADGVHLGWTSIATPAAGIESSIERSADGVTGWAERARVRSTAYTDPETSGDTYYYRVRYVNFAGQYGPYSPVTSSAGVNVGGISANASNALADAAAAQSAADAANAALADIASDNILSPVEKPVVIRDYNVITTEQAGIDAQATAYGITTEKTTYDTAVSALTSYLATLTAPVLWSDLSGNTTIVGATFRSKFADVYTTRQTLLNAIYAAAKSKADAAQATADQANANVPAVINGAFKNGTTGWTFDNPTGFYSETGANSPDSACSTYLVRQGQSGGATTYARNLGYVSVVPDQTIIATVCLKSLSANAGAYAGCRISWRDAAHVEVGTSLASVTIGPGGTYLQAVSKAIGQAPATAQFAHFELYFVSHSSGFITATSCGLTVQPASQDEVPDGTTFGRARLAALVNGTIPISGAGKSLIGNPTFSRNTMGIPVGHLVTSAGEYLKDGWQVTSTANPNLQQVSESSDILLSTVSGVTIVNNTQAVATVVSEHFPVAATESIVAEIVVGFANIGGPPAGVTVLLRPRVVFVGPGGITGEQPLPDVQRGGGTSRGTATAPAGTAGAYLAVDHYLVNTSGAPYTTGSFIADFRVVSFDAYSVASMDDEIADGAVYGRTSQSDLYVSGGVNRVGLRVAGSGHVLGNQLNAPNSLTLNYGAARTTTAITATSAGAVSINAFSVNMGGTTVSYSAVSNAITGLTQNVTYQIYCHDLGGTGGTKTWLAVVGTANALLTLGDDVVLAGQVTIPASGTSGGGGGGYCVCDNMMIDDDTLAGEAPIGYLFDCLDIPTQGMRKFRRRLQAVEYTTVPCVRITTDAGAILECSTTTPFDVLDGRTVYAPDMLGEQVVTDKGIENVARVKDIGERRVCHIHLGGVSYAAGADPAHRIYSHNLKP